IKKAKKILKNEEKANMILLRGFAKHKKFPSIYERFGLNALAIAEYPMYRGVAALTGMKLHPLTGSMENQILALKENFNKYNFFFVHFKKTDSRGEDGNFKGKVEIIEKIDKLIPEIINLNPDVLCITGDHSTPAAMGSHSWHPVPLMIKSKYSRIDNVKEFHELACIHGALGYIYSTDIMPILLSCAGKLKKFGA
ncbi:MAG: 2,3-bisphosphoglycerate-independent phosphoglycerate mutase, partial [Candidatus Odinarchaeia archaeon]